VIHYKGLHIVAYLLLKACSPKTTRRLLNAVGRLLPQQRTAEEIRAAYAAVGSGGNCLSRGLAVGATAPSAELIIGVHRDGHGRFEAHAWLELGRVPVLSDPMGEEIARLAR
jgi:hypothetical protein